jgi:hypothetical protein
MLNAHAEGTVELFCSYSHKDGPLQQSFHAHAADLRRRNLVQTRPSWRIISRDTQRKVFEISADVEAAKIASSEKMFEKWDQAIRI